MLRDGGARLLALALVAVTLAEQEQENPCDPAWVQATFVQMGCLYFEPTEKFSWDEASKNCQDEHNGTLVETINENQFDFLQLYLDMLAEHNGNEVWWTGGTDANRESRWIWSSTLTKIEDTPWMSGQPSGGTTENCLCVASNYHGLADCNCWHTYKPICQKLI